MQPDRPKTVLVVDDEEIICAMIARILRPSGYQVLVAVGPEAGLIASREHPDPIDLLVTDAVMPGRDGYALFRELAAERPGLKVLLMSGYPQKTIADTEPGVAALPFLAKPFSRGDLREAVRALLAPEQGS